MSRFVYAFADNAEQEFDLSRIGELRELQKACDAGPPVIFDRLRTNAWFVEDVSETIRLGLVGAGVSSMDAARMVKRYVHDVPAWTENAMLALAILAKALYGDEDEDLPEKSEAAG